MAAKPINGFAQRRIGISAFSLVEVVLSMGIIAFALIILVALIPVGLKSNTDSMAESQAVNLLQALIADRQAAACTNASAIYKIPALSAVTAQSTGSLFVMEDAVTTNAVAARARYRVDYTIYPAKNLYPAAVNYPVTTIPMPVTINFKVSWPAATQSVRPSSVETVATFMQP